MKILPVHQTLPKCLTNNNYHKPNKTSDMRNSTEYPWSGINSINFASQIPLKPVLLSTEIQKAFDSEDIESKKTYFQNLMDNPGLVLRTCSDDEYIKSIQVLMDNVQYNEDQEKDLFVNQINLLSLFVRPNIGLEKVINPDIFNENFKDFNCEDDEITSKINRIMEITTKKDDKPVVDVSSHSEYPVNLLSNFAETDFLFDGYRIKSIEGFLQALKTPNKQEQEYICTLNGPEAKKLGKKLNIQRNYDFVNLYWQGKKIDRRSDEYQNLLRAVYNERFKNDEDFRFALKETKDYELTHTIGENDPSRTLLTPKEFVGFLYELRENI